MVEGASDGFLWLTWYAPDGTTVSRLWPEGAVPQFDLGGTGVSGVLLDGDGVPVQGGSVALIGSLGRTVATGSSLAGGGFELPPAPPGEYLLRGRSDAGSSVAVEVELASEAPRPVVLRMPGGEPGDIALSLRRPGGAAVAGAWVHLVDTAGDVAGTGLTSERGRYANSGIPAGGLSVVWNDGTACVGGSHDHGGGRRVGSARAHPPGRSAPGTALPGRGLWRRAAFVPEREDGIRRRDRGPPDRRRGQLPVFR